MITPNEGAARLKRVQAWLAASNSDAALFSSYPAVTWLTGVPIMTIRLIPQRLEMVVVTPTDVIPLFCNIEAPLLRTYSWIKQVREYVEFIKKPEDALAEVIGELGLRSARIAFEEWHLMAEPFANLRTLLPDVTWVPAHDAMEHIRIVKSEDEIAALQEAAQRTLKVAERAFAATRAGESERTLADRLFTGIREAGADEVPFVVCSAGERTTVPHAPASSEPLRPGQVIKIDIGGSFDGYYSDVARMGVVGKPSPVQLDRYGRLMRVHKKVIDQIRPGITSADVFQLAKEAYAAEGVPFTIPHYGHGLGLDLHELPRLNPMDHTVLQPGMVLCLEPRATFAPDERYHVEDLVLVTETGSRLLSDAHSYETLLEVSV
jgi:Xaa-Pro dipeptidase